MKSSKQPWNGGSSDDNQANIMWKQKPKALKSATWNVRTIFQAGKWRKQPQMVKCMEKRSEGDQERYGCKS